MRTASQPGSQMLGLLSTTVWLLSLCSNMRRDATGHDQASGPWPQSAPYGKGACLKSTEQSGMAWHRFTDRASCIVRGDMRCSM